MTIPLKEVKVPYAPANVKESSPNPRLSRALAGVPRPILSGFQRFGGSFYE
jgi:hypothetical protein